MLETSEVFPGSAGVPPAWMRQTHRSRWRPARMMFAGADPRVRPYLSSGKGARSERRVAEMMIKARNSIYDGVC